MKTPRNSSRTQPTRRGNRKTKHIPPEWAWHYRTLLALRDHLMGGTGDRLRESCDPMEPPSLHAEDFAGELYDRELALTLPANPAEALREINDAIDRLKAGTYSRCEATGRRIPKSQLRAIPWRRFAERPRTAANAAAVVGADL